MLRWTHSPTLPLIALLAFALALGFSCSDQSTGPDSGKDAGDLSGEGTIDPGTGGQILLGSVSDSSFAPGYIEVWVSDVAFDSATGMTTFDLRLRNQTDRVIPPPIRFVVTKTIPWNVSLVGFDGVTGDGFPFMDFSAKLGDDGVLSPAEWTDWVEMKFHTVEPRSFAIGFRIDLGPMPPTGAAIAGVVFLDSNKNGVRDRCEPGSRCYEPGIPGITVALEKPLPGGDMVTLITRTDRNGEYRFGGLGEGAYKVFVAPNENVWEITSTNPLLVMLVKGPDGVVRDFLGAHFGLFPLFSPPQEVLFGPILVGPFSPNGTLVDSTFVNPPSPLTVVFHYYLDMALPPFAWPVPPVVDSASAWINGTLVFEYKNPFPPDTAYFTPQTIQIPDGVVNFGDNAIRIFTDGNEHAAVLWTVYRKP